jgi:hypothetical protein
MSCSSCEPTFSTAAPTVYRKPCGRWLKTMHATGKAAHVPNTSYVVTNPKVHSICEHGTSVFYAANGHVVRVAPGK